MTVWARAAASLNLAGLLAVTAFTILSHDACEAAGRFAWGITAGANLARYHFHDPGFVDPLVDWDNVITGQLGVRSRLQVISGTAVESGLLMDGRGVEAVFPPPHSSTEAEKLQYLVIPATVAWTSPPGRIRPFLRAGGEIGYLVRARSTFSQDGEVHHSDIRSLFPDTDVSILAGGGVIIGKRWEMAYAYDWGKTNLNKSGNRDVNHIYYRVASFAVTYWFPARQ